MKVPFKLDNGQEVEGYIDETLAKNLDDVKKSVLKQGWDYVCVVSGIVGVGKSTFAQKICKYLDPTFTTKDRICFEAKGENGFLERTSNGEKGQAFMLDESFADLNTKVTRGSDFVRIINHLQLIRQRNLFIVLCLPNFFDLSKGVAIFRTSHLFVIYHEAFERGKFAAFSRNEKRKLYVKGSKYIDYNLVKPNFRGRFTKQWIADWDLYEKLKEEHLKKQAKDTTKPLKTKRLVWLKAALLMLIEMNVKPKAIIKEVGISPTHFYDIVGGRFTEDDGDE